MTSAITCASPAGAHEHRLRRRARRLFVVISAVLVATGVATLAFAVRDRQSVATVTQMGQVETSIQQLQSELADQANAEHAFVLVDASASNRALYTAAAAQVSVEVANLREAPASLLPEVRRTLAATAAWEAVAGRAMADPAADGRTLSAQNETTALYTSFRDSLRSLSQSAVAQLQSAQDQSSNSLAGLVVAILVSFAAGILAVISASLLLFRAVLQPVEDISDSASLIIDNSDVLIPHTTRDDEIGDLARALDVSRGGAAALRHQAKAADEIARTLTGLDQAKSDFINLASHEMRGPITLLRGYLSMLRDGDIAPMSPKLESIIAVLDTQAETLSRLVEELLETARLDDNRLLLEPQRSDLRELTAEVVGTTRARLDSRHHIVVAPQSTPLPVDVDRSRIRAVIANLLDNAIKYSPRGGDIEVSLGRHRGRAELVIRDHGLGIAASDMPTLFTRFGRVVTSGNSHISGTGLGLYLCRELARRHQGEVTLTSTVQVGTVVTLSLPLGPPVPRRSTSAASSKAAPHTSSAR